MTPVSECHELYVEMHKSINDLNNIFDEQTRKQFPLLVLNGLKRKQVSQSCNAGTLPFPIVNVRIRKLSQSLACGISFKCPET